MVTSQKPLYAPVGGVLCLDFVDTIDRDGPVPLDPGTDRIPSYAELCRWVAESGALPAARMRRLARAARAPQAEAVLARARDLREAIFGCFAALAAGRAPPGDDLARLNTELARALAHLRVAGDGPSSTRTLTWSWDVGRDAFDAPLWPIARSAGELLTSPERELVKECASERCTWLFLDRTRNRHRRWCEMRVCGNRAKVRQHRRRQRGH
jgi:predicted RNA-binding Zn ribbon-like protein